MCDGVEVALWHQISWEVNDWWQGMRELKEASLECLAHIMGVG